MYHKFHVGQSVWFLAPNAIYLAVVVEIRVLINASGESVRYLIEHRDTVPESGYATALVSEHQLCDSYDNPAYKWQKVEGKDAAEFVARRIDALQSDSRAEPNTVAA